MFRKETQARITAIHVVAALFMHMAGAWAGEAVCGTSRIGLCANAGTLPALASRYLPLKWVP